MEMGGDASSAWNIPTNIEVVHAPNLLGGTPVRGMHVLGMMGGELWYLS